MNYNMKDKVWHIFENPVFSFISTPIVLNESNAKEIILSIDEAVLKAGLKYGIYELFPRDRFFNNETLKLSYKEDRLNRFWLDGRCENVYSILQTHQWVKNRINGNSLEEKYPESTYYTYENSVVTKIVYSSKVTPLLTVYSDAFRFDRKQEQHLEIIIESFFDIWYEEVYCLKDMNIIKSNIDDCKLNTPRLNSFLRDVEIELSKHNSNLKQDEEGSLYKKFRSQNRILIKGDVVYQEDVNDSNI